MSQPTINQLLIKYQLSVNQDVDQDINQDANQDVDVDLMSAEYQWSVDSSSMWQVSILGVRILGGHHLSSTMYYFNYVTPSCQCLYFPEII